MKKKLILSFLIAILMFNALLPSSIYATNGNNATNTQTNSTGKGTSQTARNEIKSLNQKEVENTSVNLSTDKNGTVTSVGGTQTSEPGNYAGVIVKIIAKIFCFPPYGLQLMMAFAVKGDNEKVAGSLTEAFDATKVNWFTIEKAITALEGENSTTDISATTSSSATILIFL